MLAKLWFPINGEDIGIAMGRGKVWDGDENKSLAKAWIAASEDPIVGTDQNRKLFIDTVRRRFIEMSPVASQVKDGTYSARSSVSIKHHFSDLSCDVQKFRASIGRVRASNPTGVGEDDVVSMAVAIHIGKTNVMDYDYKTFNVLEWVYYKSWLVLKSHPKWSEVGETAGGTDGSTPAFNPSLLSSEEANITDESQILGSTPSKTTDRYSIGMRGAKMARQEERRTQAVYSMAESAKRKAEVLEERNAIAVFSRSDAQGLPETVAFFEAIRKTYLARAEKKARLAEAGLSTLIPSLPGSSVTVTLAEMADTNDAVDGDLMLSGGLNLP